MFNIKLGFYPTIIILSALSIPIFYFIKRRFYSISLKESKNKEISTEEKFIETALIAFNKTYKEQSNVEKYNENVDPIFFSKDEYSRTTQFQGSDLEMSWRRRIFFEFTPRGNVIMFYDLYKQGFSYYSDQYISYPLLNAVAMKYVILFRCRDFFIDEHIIPLSSPSRLLAFKKQEESYNLEMNENNKKVTKIDTKTGPFAKFQSYSKPGITSSITNKKKNLPRVDNNKREVNFQIKELFKNKFIHLGKIANLCVLNVIPKKNKMNNNTKSKLENDIEQNSDIQNAVFSYKNFKLSRGLMNK